MQGNLYHFVGAMLPAAFGLALFGMGHLMLPPAVPAFDAAARAVAAAVAEEGDGAAEDGAAPTDEAGGDASGDTQPQPRHYVRIQEAVSSSIPSLGGIVQVQIALAVPERQRNAILATIQSRPEDLITPLSETLRVTAETAPSLEALHDLLPEAFRAAVNARLGDDALPAPVLEVLIVSLLISQ